MSDTVLSSDPSRVSAFVETPESATKSTTSRYPSYIQLSLTLQLGTSADPVFLACTDDSAAYESEFERSATVSEQANGANAKAAIIMMALEGPYMAFACRSAQ